MRHCFYLILFLSCISSLVITQAQAQPLSTTMALRYIKVGNTLREAKQYAQAKQFLEKALGSVQKSGDRYWTAAAYENLGLLARDRNDATTAGFYLAKALDGYRSSGANTSAKIVQQILSGVKNDKNSQELYGGIDIGAKGVKMTIIALGFSADGKPSFSVIKSDSRNTSAMEATPAAFAETAKAVGAYVDSLITGRKIPKERIFIVGSSGLKQNLSGQIKEGN